jgi:mRNA interferase RelE/StbE
LREWRKLPADVQRRIRRRLEAFAESGVGDVKRLQGRDGSRMRIGDWRVIFMMQDGLIIVTGVGHRREVYD